MYESIIPYLLQIPSICICKETSWWAEHWVEFIGTISTLYVTWYIYRIQEKNYAIQQRDNAIQEARTTLLSPYSITNNKKEAIETLAKYRQSLDGIEIIGTAEKLVDLRGLDLSEKTLGYKINLTAAKFEYCMLGGAKFNGANLQYAIFSHTSLYCAQLNCESFYKTQFFDTDLTDTDFSSENERGFYKTIFEKCYAKNYFDLDPYTNTPDITRPKGLQLIIKERRTGSQDEYYIEIEGTAKPLKIPTTKKKQRKWYNTKK